MPDDRVETEPISDGKEPESRERPGSKAAAADARLANIIRTSPPPEFGGQPAARPTGSTPAGSSGAPGSTPGKGETTDAASGGQAGRTPAPRPRLVSVSAEEAGAPAPTDGSDDDPEKRWLSFYGGDRQRAAREALELNNRAAAQAARIKELEAQAQGGKAPAKPGDETQTPPPPEGEPAEPALPEDGSPEFNTILNQVADRDPECVSLRRSFAHIDKELGGIVTVDEQGVPTAGMLVDVAKRISALRVAKDPKAAGVPSLPEPDEITREEIQRDLDRAESELERLQSRRERLLNEREKLAGRFDARVATFERSLKARARAARTKAEEEVQRSQDETRTRQEWSETFSEITKNDRDPEFVAHLEETLAAKAAAIFDVRDIPDFPQWIREEGERIRRLYFRGQGQAQAQQDRATARQKIQDGRQPAPVGAAADASPSQTAGGPDMSAREKRRLADRRADTLSRAIVVR